MPSDEPADAAAYARRHAGERDADLTAEQRDLLGRVVASRLERGAKLEAIARAAGGALTGIETDRAQRLGRDAALEASAWETLVRLRRQGTESIGISPAQGACPACRAVYGHYAAGEVPQIPIASCSNPQGCRCVYVAGPELPPPPEPTPNTHDSTIPARPWYRPRPPRPHGPRWSEERKETARRTREQAEGKKRRKGARPKRPRTLPDR